MKLLSRRVIRNLRGSRHANARRRRRLNVFYDDDLDLDFINSLMKEEVVPFLSNACGHLEIGKSFAISNISNLMKAAYLLI